LPLACNCSTFCGGGAMAWALAPAAARASTQPARRLLLVRMESFLGERRFSIRQGLRSPDVRIALVKARRLGQHL
jgi:hypothetical protein